VGETVSPLLQGTQSTGEEGADFSVLGALGHE
jgi:hypothetical protein